MVVQATNRSGVTMPMTGIVPKFSRTPGRISDVGPWLGEHTEDILRQLAGVDDAEWATLQSSGIVG
jgi:crotonobetainyl-CoA:carnitine CoA-transferase CaiB-like acyl-CoA transferase